MITLRDGTSRKVLSLGAGVQSTFLALAMTEKYRISKVYEIIKGSVVIFADTGSEKPETIKYFNFIVLSLIFKRVNNFCMIICNNSGIPTNVRSSS